MNMIGGGADIFVNWLWMVSWQSALIAAVVLLITMIFRKGLSAKWRCCLWSIVFVRLAIPVLPASPWSIYNTLHQPAPVQKQVSELISSSPPLVTDLPVQETIMSQSEGESTFNTEEQFLSGHDSKTPASWRSYFLNHWKPILVVIWLAGMGLLFLWMFICYWRMKFRLRIYEDVNAPEIRSLFEECKSRMGIRGKVRLQVADALCTPALVGLLHPRILLPARVIRNFSSAELNHVFLHELGHLKRFDVWTNWALLLLQTVHWFNPMVWWVAGKIRTERELACDELVMSLNQPEEVSSYGNTLLKILETVPAGQMYSGAVGLANDYQQLRQRIQFIASFRKAPLWARFLGVLLLVTIAFTTLTGAETKGDGRITGTVGFQHENEFIPFKGRTKVFLMQGDRKLQETTSDDDAKFEFSGVPDGELKIFAKSRIYYTEEMSLKVHRGKADKSPVLELKHVPNMVQVRIIWNEAQLPAKPIPVYLLRDKVFYEISKDLSKKVDSSLSAFLEANAVMRAEWPPDTTIELGVMEPGTYYVVSHIENGPLCWAGFISLNEVKEGRSRFHPLMQLQLGPKPSQGLTFQFKDQSGALLTNQELLFDEERVVTSRDGILFYNRMNQRRSPWRFECLAKDFKPAGIDVPNEPESADRVWTVTMERDLAPKGSIQGMVVLPDGKAAPKGIAVYPFVIRSTSFLGLGKPIRDVHNPVGEPSFTDENGMFEIKDLPAGIYEVIATPDAVGVDKSKVNFSNGSSERISVETGK